jgi:hypothetical protein
MGVLFWVNPDQRVSGIGEWEGFYHSENQLQSYTLPFGLNVRNRQKSEPGTPACAADGRLRDPTSLQGHAANFHHFRDLVPSNKRRF